MITSAISIKPGASAIDDDSVFGQVAGKRRVRLTMPPLAVEYAVAPGALRTPMIEAILRMRPACVRLRLRAPWRALPAALRRN